METYGEQRRNAMQREEREERDRKKARCREVWRKWTNPRGKTGDREVQQTERNNILKRLWTERYGEMERILVILLKSKEQQRMDRIEERKKRVKVKVRDSSGMESKVI